MTNVANIAAALNTETATRDEILTKATELGMSTYAATKVLKEFRKVGRGVYALDTIPSTPVQMAKVELASAVQSITNDEVYVPPKDPTYIKWGSFSDINTIITSGLFYPVFITGLSGNGKTMMVEQACAANGREYVRVQITPETDEDDLIGGFRLVDGETVFFKGPVVKAMEAGAILLIDELDRGSNKLMCLQGVMEGKPVLLKKTGEVITPRTGFNVIATANTKGRGSDDGKFSAAGILDEAFLERFPITIEQPFAPASTELRILNAFYKAKFPDAEFDKDMFAKLVEWADHIRKTYFDEGVDEVISTRRLTHIVQTFGIFKDMKKSIELCISRFDTDTKESFVDLYSKVVGESEESNTRANALDPDYDPEPF